MEFPLTSEAVLSIPKFGLGRNVLGVIYMQLREMVYPISHMFYEDEFIEKKSYFLCFIWYFQLRDGVLPYKGKTKKVLILPYI